MVWYICWMRGWFSIAYITSLWCNVGNGYMENHPSGASVAFIYNILSVCKYIATCPEYNLKVQILPIHTSKGRTDHWCVTVCERLLAAEWVLSRLIPRLNPCNLKWEQGCRSWLSVIITRRSQLPSIQSLPQCVYGIPGLLTLCASWNTAFLCTWV